MPLTSCVQRQLTSALATSSGSLRAHRACPPALPTLRPRGTARPVRTGAVMSAPPAQGARAQPTATPTLTSEEEASLVRTIHSTAELDEVIASSKDRLVVLMCKAKSCKPCRLFMRKYRALAAYYRDSVFLEVYGDESPELRGLMKSESVRVTPTFILYRGSRAKLHQHGGIKEASLHEALQPALREGEAGKGPYQLLFTDEPADDAGH